MPSEKKSRVDIRTIGVAAAIVFLIGGGIATWAYLAVQSKVVAIDTSSISAPLVAISPSKPDILRDVYVNVGDTVPPNTVVAQVGTELLKSTAGGLVVTVNNNIGKQVGPQDTVVETVDPTQLRVVGKLDEDKGLSLIKVGDPVRFTVDAFGGKQYTGVVDEIAPTANASGVVFNISDSRQTQQFNVKVRFDTTALAELKNGMSARMWVYVQ